MGTALTERQRELRRLTERLFLCFDSDAAGEEATLRGMELAVGQGFDVRVVALPKGKIRRTIPPVSRSSRRSRVVPDSSDRSGDQSRETGSTRICASRHPERDSRVPGAAGCLATRQRPSWHHDSAGPELRSGGASPSDLILMRAGRKRWPCVHDGLVPILAEMSPEHFDNDLHRRLRAHLVDEGEAEADLVPLIAELDARAAADAIDEATGKEPLAARMEACRELAAADLEHTRRTPRTTREGTRGRRSLWRRHRYNSRPRSIPR